MGRDDRLLPRDDVDAVDASAILKIQFEREGIELLLGAERVAAARVKAAATLSLARGGKREPRSSDAVLVATGRTLNLDGLGLDIARITITERGIEVDDLRTTNRRVYAAGDVASRWFAS